MHKDQALVLVNYGKATGREILDLAGKIQRSVKEKFGVDLEREVNVGLRTYRNAQDEFRYRVNREVLNLIIFIYLILIDMKAII